jgi:DNA-binding HxlR family transcriptional regulator
VSDELAAYCPRYQRAAEIIGRRWTGAILRALIAGHARFSEIGRIVPGVSDRLLSERLKELEDEGIVKRTVTGSHPVRVDYELTEMGLALIPVVRAVAAWAEEFLPVPAT